MDQKKRLTFISRSDLRGGAAIVTYRLVEALRKEGVDARMLVCEKMSDSDFVEACAPNAMIQFAFLKERLDVYMHNGHRRDTLFKIDPGSDGLPLWRHEWVKNADAIIIGWVNQGMLSLDGVRKLESLGKPLLWIMHDMWNMTGVCHHAGTCSGYMNECGDCMLLGKKAGTGDMSHRTWQRKQRLYADAGIRFVAVSTWLAERARQSSLMKKLDVCVVPNPFTLDASEEPAETDCGDMTGIAFGAARLDDPIKGLPVLKEALRLLADRYPEEANNMQLVTFGGLKDPDALSGIAVSHRHLGVLKGHDAIKEAYRSCGIVVSTSEYETLPGTLVEGQAYGCIPVAVDHGGQKDIVEHLRTGWLAPWSDSERQRAESVAEGILWAYRHRNDRDLKARMRKSVEQKFDASAVARRILSLCFPQL